MIVCLRSWLSLPSLYIKMQQYSLYAQNAGHQTPCIPPASFKLILGSEERKPGSRSTGRQAQNTSTEEAPQAN